MKYSRKPAKRVYRKKTNGGKKRVSLAIKSYVKKSISRNIEKKVWFSYGANNSINSAGYTNWQSLLPAISQGVTESQRIGNIINVTRAVVNGYVNILPYNSVSNTLSTAVLIKIWVCKYKNSNGGNFATMYNNATDFFDVGSTNVGFQSNILDTILTCNKNDWHWYHQKTFKIGAASATTAGAVGSGGYYDNSPMTHPFSFNYSKHVKKLVFNDNLPTPTNNNMFLVFQAVYADGSSAAQLPAEYHYSTRVEYADA